MRTIEAELDADSLDKAVKQLRAYQRLLERAAGDTAMGLAEMGAECAKSTYDSYDKPAETGELGSSIAAGRTAGGARVVAACEHADFFEFGTGVVGLEDAPYQYGRDNDAFDSYEVGQKIGSAGHFEHNGRDAWRYGSNVTNGMGSRPFMAPAALLMRANVEKAAREALR